MPDPARTSPAAAPGESPEALEIERALSASLIESLPGAFFLLSPEGTMLRWNARMQEALGYAHEHIAGMRALDFIAEPDRRAVAAALRATVEEGHEVSVEARMQNRAGEARPVVITARPFRAGSRTLVLGFGRDLSQRERAEEELRRAKERAEYLATRDALTGLPNRVLLLDRLEQGIVNAARQKTGVAFMFVDLDRFKTINDTLGHDVGDALLKRVAARLSACVRASDTVARLGGDEFAVILENLDDTDDEGAQHVAEKMIGAMAEPMLAGGQHLSTSCSIGIALFPGDGRDSASLMKSADIAMYEAKESGRNAYRFFSAELNARAQERLSVENYLRLALQRNELVLHYQPRIRIADGALTGVEALVRWMHPRRGLLPAARFIDVAEDSGLIVPIGEWVLASACRQVQEWRRRLGRPLRLAVNLSVRQFASSDRLLAAVKEALGGAGLEPDALELELTEGLIMHDASAKAACLRRLGELGVRLAIDDFGTGYSSLSYLRTLPVDAIKIDRSFVSDLGAETGGMAIVRAVIAMAHSLRLQVTAEGVETEAQLAQLAELGCDEYQGYLACEPLPPAEFERDYLGRAAGRGSAP